MEFKDLTNEEKVEEKKEFAKIIGSRIREARKAKGFTQERLAEMANYDSAYIGHLETGRYSPSVHTLWRVSKALGIKMAEILKGL
jgi:transcriptional regulator with XRE-family HTH domain